MSRFSKLIHKLLDQIKKRSNALCALRPPKSEYIPSDNNIYFIGSYGQTRLRIPNHHPLRDHLKNHLYYDRFLPRLAERIDKTIIDVGANIGDTALHMAAFTSSSILAVEPDPNFLYLMEQNIKANNRESQISIFPYAISASNYSFTICKNQHESTSSLCANNEPDIGSTHNSKTFKQLLVENDLQCSDIGLIKIDVDSMDWDCINSLCDCWDEPNAIDLPVIFFEMCPLHPYNHNDLSNAETLKTNYLKSISRLISLGYDYFQVFDNYGTPLLHTESLSEIECLIDYLHLTIMQQRTPFYYFDIACGSSRKGHVDKIFAALEAMKEDCQA